MATQMVEIEGIFEWAKVFEVNRDHRYSEETDGEYQLSVIMDDDNAKKLKAAGCQKKMESDPEGRGTVVRLTRPHKAMNAWAGGPPKLAGPDGTAWSLEDDGMIGNGSSGRVLAAVFETKTGRKGTRLEAVQVIDLVRYESEGDGGGASATSSFFKDYTKDQPKAATKSAAKAPAPDLEDEIPF